MKISKINTEPIIPLKAKKTAKSVKEASPDITDKFSKSLSVADSHDNALSKISRNSSKCKSAERAAKIDENQNDTLPEGRAFKITDEYVMPIIMNHDGGYVVENETKTKAFLGKHAKEFLQNTTHFEKETEVIVTAKGKVEVEYNGETLNFSERGAILIGAGTDAKINVLKGDVLVTQMEKTPSWYKKLRPDGDLKGKFEHIGHVNQKLYKCLTGKNRFNGEDLQKMVNFGIVKHEDNESISWDSSIKNEESLKSRLIEAGIQGKSIDNNTKIWYNSIKRKLQQFDTGKLAKSELNGETLQKLANNGITKEYAFDKEHVYWADYSTEDELRNKLSQKEINGNELEDVVGIWKKTTKSGYDNTGLTWDKGKVVAYLLREKINIWNEQNTEWLVNSTEYAGTNEPFMVGVSNVKSPDKLSEPSAFKEIRASETIHRHPILDGEKKQTESYLLTNGRAVLLTVIKGKPHLNFLTAGDMAVISPGVPHCVLAADGDYEHMCFQVPSTFHYGMIFKDELKYESMGMDEKSLLNEAIKGLKENRHGTFEAYTMEQK